METIDDVLDFWFAEGMAAKWFVRDREFDAEVRARLFPLHETAAAGALDHWRDSGAGCVALCILLDQVPRNVFRDDPRAYATDEAARTVVRHAVATGRDRDLPTVRRLFLYLPFEHSEALADQDLSVDLIGRLDGDVRWLADALRHREIVARFGRFPHRNPVLGRETTPEEAAFLAEPGSSY